MMKRSDRFPSLVVKLSKLVAILGLVSLVSNNLVSAEPPWPTPPPAPQAPRPEFEEDITPVDVPPLLGAASAVIQPIPQGIIPVVPPLNSTIFEVPEHLKVTIEAGSLYRTIQLTYVPLFAGETPPADKLQRVVRAFDLKSFDHLGQEVQPTLRRPFIVEVPVSKLLGPPTDPKSLLFARFEEGRWMPLVTSYFRDDGVLVTRILKPGRFAIIEELRPN